MFGKLAEAKQKAEEIRKRLEQVQVLGRSSDGSVKAVVNGRRRVVELQIDENLTDPALLKQNLIEAVNSGLEQADNVAEAEMASVAKDMLPGGLGALGSLLKK